MAPARFMDEWRVHSFVCRQSDAARGSYPDVGLGSPRMTLSGAVERPVLLTMEDLKKFPASRIVELVRLARAAR